MAEAHHIIELQAENVKRLKAIKINPEGSMVEITGENGAGKSSLLDAITFALGGKEVIQDMPIRAGESTAKVVLKTETLTITRTFTLQEDGSYKTYLSVENSEGMKASKPQDFIAGLVGNIAFDPLEFTRMDSKKQFDMLKGFVKGFDFDENAAARKRAFDARTDVNRQIKDLKAQVAAINVADGTPEEPIDITALVDELNGIGEANAMLERRKANRENVAGEIRQYLSRADELRAQAEKLRAEASKLDLEASAMAVRATDLQNTLDNAEPLPEPKDATEIRTKITKAQMINEHVRRLKDRNARAARLEELEARAKALTDQIQAQDDAKAEAIAKAEMPVEGIGFGDGVVLLDGVPFEQASSAQQIAAAAALCMAANPKFRICIIKDGSLLGKKAFKMLGDIAAKHGFQIFVETVESSRDGAIVIEDGGIRQLEMLEAAE